MARIRAVNINNFRRIKKLVWFPSPGLNCLIGSGDSGKSSILDAIDFCLGARRNIQFSDADFYQLNVEAPITIAVTVGELDDKLKSIDAYGLYVRSFDSRSGKIEDEPEKDAETVLTLQLTVDSDLEPTWSLVSDRAEALGQTRNLNWSDRVQLSPTRLGLIANHHLAWRRDSVLNRISEERADASAALVKAARDARAAFGGKAHGQLSNTLNIVASTAKELGVPIGETVQALLDADSVSFNSGAISLHNDTGIPLRGLGTGSTRLLIAGLQRKAATQSTIILIDELEHGLEPHRIIRFLSSLGAKEREAPLQAFMTTHSPAAIRELSGSQLFVIRPFVENHVVFSIGTDNDTQSAIRIYPEAFLARSVIVCEGASEVGLVRGLDLYWTNQGCPSIYARGVALIDGGGGEADKPFKRAITFQSLKYRTAILRDNDTTPTAEIEAAFIANSGEIITWRDGRTLEDELFASLSDEGVIKLIERAIELHGQDLINDNIKSASSNITDITAIYTEMVCDRISLKTRKILGQASRKRRAGWFKSITRMEDVARDIVGPDLKNSDDGFRELIANIFDWASSAGE